jgi:hypothetical protein
MTSGAIILLGGLGVIAIVVFDHILNVFRSNVKVGDVVGVDFGNEVIINRIVRRVEGEEVVVDSLDLQREHRVKLNALYIHTQYEPRNERYEE